MVDLSIDMLARLPEAIPKHFCDIPMLFVSPCSSHLHQATDAGLSANARARGHLGLSWRSNYRLQGGAPQL